MSNQPIFAGRTWGMILLAFFLIIWGGVQVLHLTFNGIDIVLGLLALISGILLLIGR